jgi:hypothetical protein
MPMLRLLSGPRLYLSTGYARSSTPAPTSTSFNTTFVLSFIMRIIVTSELSHPTNSSGASGSLTKSPVDYHTLITSMHWTPQCLPVPWCGSSSKFICIFCTFVMQTVNLFAKPICRPSCHYSGICQRCNRSLPSITGMLDSGILQGHRDGSHLQPRAQSFQN